VVALNNKIADLLLTVGWSVTTSFIILQALYQRLQEPLTPTEVVLIFIVSAFAGMLIVDAEAIILSYLGLLSLSILTVYFSLTLPASLGVIQYASLRAILFEGVIGIVTRIALLYLLLPCLIGGILGGILGERLK